MTTNIPLMELDHQCIDSNPSSTTQIVDAPKRRRTTKTRKSDVELVKMFWISPEEAFFGQEVIAPVSNKSIKTLESDRWRGAGIPYRKIGGRVLYQKRDVINWLESHALVTSTSEYCKEDQRV
jgi:hypothetical protein